MTERFIQHDDGTIVVENPGEIFQLLQFKHLLSIEIKTGLRHSRGSVMNAAKARFGLTGRTKREVLAQIENLLAARAKNP